MATAAPSPDLPEAPHWAAGMARNGLRTLLLGVAVAAFLSLVFDQHFPTTLLYAECISVGCWFFIDGGRLLAGRWVHRRAPRASEAALNLWPGWGWMTACLLFGTVAGLWLGNLAGDWLSGRATADPLRSGVRPMLSMLAISLLPAVGFSYYHYSQRRLRAAQAREESARRQAAEHQLKLLESQLEPHMLFNTLANLRVLIALDPPRAQAMLDRLIAFLRATLGGSRAAQQPLRAEFDRLADYLALMQVRMGERLRVGFDLPDALADASVPPLLLQPLVENCIQHGLEPNVDGGRIDIGAARDGGDTLVLSVRDTGRGLPADPADPADPAGSAAHGTGFGLQQVRERLATLYGDAASLRLQAVDAAVDAEGGTLATVRLPLRWSTVPTAMAVGAEPPARATASAAPSVADERIRTTAADPTASAATR